MSEPQSPAAILTQVFHETLNIEPERLKPETRLSEDLGLDSLDRIQLVFDVEERFEIEIPEEKMEDVRTFGDILERLQEAASAGEVTAAD